jgi:hypothetical protein
MKYVICPQCKMENPGSLLVCDNCGASLAGIERLEKPESADYFMPSAPLPGIPVSPSISYQPPTPAQTAQLKQGVRNRMLRGANWFFWIAGLSLVNSVTARINEGVNFVMGVGSTQLVDGVALGLIEEDPNLAVFFHAVAIALDLVILGSLVLYGILGRKGYRPVFIIGMVLYALDSLLFVWVRDYMSLLFHLLALWGLFSGLRASFEYAKLNADPLRA